MKQPKLFLDMDGVLADFDKRAAGVLGMGPYDFERMHGAETFWNTLYAEPHFFSQMEKMHDADDLVRGVQHLNPTILTGKPRSRPGQFDASSQKEQWRDIHYPDLPLISCPAREKSLHMEPGDIIIDDRLQHSHLWLERGGIWIHHVSAERSLHILQRLGIL